MGHDKLKIGREREKAVAETLVEYAIIKAFWCPPRAKYYDGGQDAFGVFDVLAIGVYGDVVGIQVCRKRPAEIHIRQKKLESFAKRFMPAMRCFLAIYTKDGFILEELMPSFTWRLVGALPWASANDRSGQ